MENTDETGKTVIYYSSSNLMGWLLFLLVLEWGCVYDTFFVRPVSAGGVFTFFIGIVCFIGICRQIWLLVHNEPQLTISALGIRVASAALDSWVIIQDEKVKNVAMSRGSEPKLLYKVGDEMREISIRKLATNSSQLTMLLQLYRAQFESQNMPT